MTILLKTRLMVVAIKEITLATSLDMNIELCFCSLWLRFCTLATIKHYKSRIRMRITIGPFVQWLLV